MAAGSDWEEEGWVEVSWEVGRGVGEEDERKTTRLHSPPTTFRVSNCSGGTCLWSRKWVTARGNGGDFIKLVWERQQRNSHAGARARERVAEVEGGRKGGRAKGRDG